MKKFILFILLLGCSITTYYFKDDITLYIEDYLHSKIITIDNKNNVNKNQLFLIGYFIRFIIFVNLDFKRAALFL